MFSANFVSFHFIHSAPHTFWPILPGLFWYSLHDFGMRSTFLWIFLGELFLANASWIINFALIKAQIGMKAIDWWWTHSSSFCGAPNFAKRISKFQNLELISSRSFPPKTLDYSDPISKLFLYLFSTQIIISPRQISSAKPQLYDIFFLLSNPKSYFNQIQ